LAYWLILIPIVLIANDRKKAVYTLYALFAVSVLLSVVAVLQSAFGLRLNFSGLSGVAELSSEDGGIAGLLRSMLPGVLIVIFTFVLAVIKLVTRAKNSYLWWILCLLNTMALFVTFGRGVWAMTVLTTILAAALVGKNALVRLIFIGGFFATIFISIAFVARPDFVIGAFDRILSVQTELSGKGTSYAWRVQENHFAKIAMQNNPIMGIGLGGEYKPRLIDMRAFAGQTFYIHNGYYYVTLKLGLIGLVFYMANYLNIIRLCWINQRTPGVDRIPQMALIAVFTGTLILNVTQPEFMQGPSIASLASLSAVVVALGMWQRNPSNLQNVPIGA
jgi:O-antigen ligase